MKTFRGQVVSTKMKDTIIVEVTRRVPHPLYKKLLKRSSRFKASAPAHTVSVGDTVSIMETKPIAKSVHFKLMEAKAKVDTSVKQEATTSKATSTQRRVKK